MKFFKFLLAFSSFVLIQSCFAHNLDCSNFYRKIDDYESKLKELHSFLKPLSNQKLDYLNNLEISSKNYSNQTEYKRASELLYNDIDYGQYAITKSLVKLIERVELFKQNHNWEKDRSLLIKASMNRLDPNKNYWGNNPYENLSLLTSDSIQSSLFIRDFMTYSSDWKRSRRTLTLEQIQWVELNAIDFFYAYSSIANCHANFLFYETNEALTNKLEKK